MKLFLIFFLSLNALNASAQEFLSINDSHKYILGIAIAENPESLPKTIDIPETWLSLFKELSAKTKQLSIEHGACLKFITDVDEKTKIGSELKIKWLNSETRTGDKDTVIIESIFNSCGDNFISDVHTHPNINYPPIFSKPDVEGFINSKRLTRFVANNNGGFCMLIKSRYIHKTPQNLTSLRIRKSLPYHWIGGQTLEARRDANILEFLGLAKYCSDKGTTMAKIEPYDETGSEIIDDELYILGAKAYLLAMEWHMQNQVLPTSEFTPKIDSTFINYLENILPRRAGITSDLPIKIEGFKISSKNDEKLSQPVVKMAARELFEYSVSHFATNKNHQYIQAMTGCTKTQDDIMCSVETDNDDSAQNIALYLKSRKISTVIIKTRNGFDLKSNTNGILYEGQCKYINKVCISEGLGRLEHPNSFLYRGNFSRGKMSGIGVIESRETGETWEVEMNIGELIKKIKKLN